MNNEYKNHTCGELTIKNVGEEVRLAGWVQRIRNLGAMKFIDLRDDEGITQIVIKEELSEIAKELGIPKSTVIDWVKKIQELTLEFMDTII